jgi:hypothetical protein
MGIHGRKGHRFTPAADFLCCIQGLLLKLGILFAEGFGGSFPFLSAGTFSIAFILFETAF